MTQGVNKIKTIFCSNLFISRHYIHIKQQEMPINKELLMSKEMVVDTYTTRKNGSAVIKTETKNLKAASSE